MKIISSLFIITLFINGAVTETVSVYNGFSLTLHTNALIQSSDVIEWRYEEDLIAKLHRGSVSFFNDERFRDRLKMNDQTGDLTITNITSQLDGHYHLQITGEKTGEKTFSVNSLAGYAHAVMSYLAMEADSVKLNSDARDEDYDVICWRFNNAPLAEFNRKTKVISTHDERFTGRLELDHYFGDLTIKNVTTDFSGLYEISMDSNSGSHTIHKTCKVTVRDEVTTVTGEKGGNIILFPEFDQQNEDEVLWWFGPYEANIVETYRDTLMISEMDTNPDERFLKRLHFNNKTGSLTITNITADCSRRYEVKTFGRTREIRKRFIMIVSGVTGGTCASVLLVIAAACVWSQIF